MISFDKESIRVLTTGLRFPEGPIACDDGSVLVAEMEDSALTRVAVDGSKFRIPCGGGANGAAFGPDGAVYVCNNGGLDFTTEGEIRFPNAIASDNEGGYLQRIDLSTGDVQLVFSHVDGVPMGKPTWPAG